MNTMKSKSFDLKQVHNDKNKLSKTFDFVGLYKSAADTEKNVPEKRKASDIPSKDSSKSKQETPKRERSPYKNRKKPRNDSVDISHISIDGSNLNSSVGPSTPRNDPKNTSTPLASVRKSASDTLGKVKSIMKTTAVNQDDTMDGTKTVQSNPKKRNKSVSFMLDENEEVVVKRTKSDDSISQKKDTIDAKRKLHKDKKKQLKKLRKEHLSEKENNLGDINQNVEKSKEKRKKIQANIPTESVESVTPTETQEKKKKPKKIKREKNDIEDATQSNTETGNNQHSEPLTLKVKKKKHKTKTDGDGEPVIKSSKKDIKPDVIAEHLENLSLGDTAHTLACLIDEMVVADKKKRVKSKLKHKEKKKVVENNKTPPTEEETEKVKWKKRKWNKDKKGEIDTDSLATSIIVENLPLSIMLTYKKILADHFGKYGLIKKIGVAEMYPTVESTPVFTTVINFYSDGAATQALEEDNVLLEGSHIQVKRPLPATETTLVLRSYAELNEQNICTLFVGAGKIRNIRHMVKGKKAMSTAFVEFDGPESVKKAMKIASDVKVGGKKVHIAKFQIRTHKTSKTDKSEDSKPDEEKSKDSND